LLALIQIAVAKPPPNEDVRLALSLISHQTTRPPPPAPPTSPTSVRPRPTRVPLRRRKCSVFPAATTRCPRPDGRAPRPATGGVRLGTGNEGHLLTAMVIKPALRDRDGVTSGRDDLNIPVTSRRRQVRPSTRQLKIGTVQDSSVTGHSRPSTRDMMSVQTLNVRELRKGSNAVADRSSTSSTLPGRRLYAEGPKESPVSLAHPVKRRPSCSEKRTVVRGLPSKTGQTHHAAHHKQRSMSPSQLPQVRNLVGTAVCFSFFFLYTFVFVFGYVC